MTGKTLEQHAAEAVRHPLCPPSVADFVRAVVRDANQARQERDTMMRQALEFDRRLRAVEGGADGGA